MIRRWANSSLSAVPVSESHNDNCFVFFFNTEYYIFKICAKWNSAFRNVIHVSHGYSLLRASLEILVQKFEM